MKQSLFAILISICLVSAPSEGKAQYTITALAPPPSFTFNDLWHFSLTRTTADAYNQFYVSLRVFNAGNTLKIKSNTATFILPTGSQYFNLSNIITLQPFSTSYYDAATLQQVVSSGGVFPPGTYNMAYTLYGKTADGEFTPLAEDAFQTLVESMWPPMLLSPNDGETIHTAYPPLTWTPAFSSTYVGPITYRLNLVELLPGQNGYQAIQSNPNYFTQSDIPATTLVYPSTAQALDTGKVYAWQVHADGNGTPMGSSEIWTFTLDSLYDTENPLTDSVPIYYFDMERSYPLRFMEVTQKVIRFKYMDEYNQNSLPLPSFFLYREGTPQPMLTAQTCNSCLFTYKDVYYTLRLDDYAEFTPGHYLLRIDNIKNRSYYLRILYRNE